jgi:hypothetical protein
MPNNRDLFNAIIERLDNQDQSLTTINLSQQNLSKDDIELLLFKFMNKKFIKHIVLAGNLNLDDSDAILLAQILPDMELEVLDLSNTNLTAKGLCEIFNLVKEKNALKELRLQGTVVDGIYRNLDSYALMSIITPFIASNTLKILDLSGFYLNLDAMQILAYFIQHNTSVEQLILRGSALEYGLPLLAKSLANNYIIQVVDIDCMHDFSIGEIQFFAAMLEGNHTKFKELNISIADDCAGFFQGQLILKSLLKNKSLEAVRMDGYLIFNLEDLLLLIEVLQTNNTLKKLSIGSVSPLLLGDINNNELFAKFIKALENNYTLYSMRFSYCTLELLTQIVRISTSIQVVTVAQINYFTNDSYRILQQYIELANALALNVSLKELTISDSYFCQLLSMQIANDITLAHVFYQSLKLNCNLRAQMLTVWNDFCHKYKDDTLLIIKCNNFGEVKISNLQKIVANDNFLPPIKFKTKYSI